jgi:hypothetical protein
MTELLDVLVPSGAIGRWIDAIGSNRQRIGMRRQDQGIGDDAMAGFDRENLPRLQEQFAIPQIFLSYSRLVRTRLPGAIPAAMLLRWAYIV